MLIQYRICTKAKLLGCKLCYIVIMYLRINVKETDSLFSIQECSLYGDSSAFLFPKSYE